MSPGTSPSGSAAPTVPADVPTTGPNLLHPGERPPVMPALATQHTPEGAVAFAKFFIQTIDWGFATQDAPEIIAITALTNLKSQAVMQRLGMVRDLDADFAHPKLAEDHPLRPHVTFRLKRP